MVQRSGQRQPLLQQRKSLLAIPAVAGGSPLAEQGHRKVRFFIAVVAEQAHAERGQLGGSGVIFPR